MEPQAAPAPAPQAPVIARTGSVRQAPADRTEISERSAESRIAELLNPKIKEPTRTERPRHEPDPEPDPDIDAPIERNESTARRDQREKAEESAEAPAPADEPGDGEVSLDDTPDPAKRAAVEDEPFEYTDEATGRKYLVPKALVDGAMRQSHFTKVTEEVAAEKRYNVALRQHLEVDQAIMAEMAPSVSQLQQLEQAIEQLRLQKTQPATTVERYIELDKQLGQLEAARTEFQSAVTKRSTEFSAQKQAIVGALQSAADNYLSKALPKWNDNVKKAVFNHMVESGLTPEEVTAMYDPRVIRAFHDAALLKKIQSKRTATIKQVQQAAPVVRPQGRPSTEVTERQQTGKLKAQAQRSGRDADAESAISRLLRASRDRGRR